MTTLTNTRGAVPTEQKPISSRTTATIVGVLFVVQMVTAMVGTSLIQAFVDGNKDRVPLTLGVLSMMGAGLAVVSIGLGILNLLPLLGEDENAARAQAQAAIDAFPALFEAALTAGFRAKLGLRDAEPDDMAMVQDLLDTMAANEADFTLTFRGMSDGALPEMFDAWRTRWQERLRNVDRDLMRAVNPAFIPRNHRVEEALAAATEGDFAPFEMLVKVLSRPYEDQPEFAPYRDPPRPEQVVQRTFCGT